MNGLDFDILVVGAGPGGCAIAARLAETRPAWRIALLEAGPARGGALVRMPLGIAHLAARPGPYNYALHTVPQAELHGRKIPQPRGRGVGGSSLINAMVYIRGHAEDYDAWAAAGCDGWGWEDMLPLFRRAENNSRGIDDYHGRGGPVHVSDPWHKTPVTGAFLDACREAGYPATPDFNGDRQEGVGYYQLFQKDGRRSDAGSAYIHSVRPPNLTLFEESQAIKLVVEDGRVTGALARTPGGERFFSARREVVLACGAFATPQILMLSGIGPARHLQQLGLPVVADRGEVGENLQDHPNFASKRLLQGSGIIGPTLGGAAALLKGVWPYLRGRGGALSSNLAEAGAFLRSSPDKTRPDIQLHFMVGMAEEDGAPRRLRTGIALHSCLLRPASRGNVRLAGPTHRSGVHIDPRYLSAPGDLEGMIGGVRIAETILSQPAFERLGARTLEYGALTRDSEIEESIRARAGSIYHPVGTCRMGSDRSSVVDPRLKVRGIERLRIADASIMPTIISGNTQATASVIGERAANLIAADSDP
jgi:choline dehydrogenase-like flavoprotein